MNYRPAPKPQAPVTAPPPTPAKGTLTERLVSLTGVEPDATLQKFRDAQKVTELHRVRETRLVAELATYEARYGFPSHWEHERKALLSRLAMHERERALAHGQKVTESWLEQYAHSHGEYRSFLDAARRDREIMEKLRADLVEVRNQIETAKGVEVFYERTARREDSLIWMSGREMELTR